MDAGETRRNGKTGTDGDFFVTVDPRNLKRLKEEEEEDLHKCAFKLREPVSSVSIVSGYGLEDLAIEV
jgi:hypothetical protein